MTDDDLAYLPVDRQLALFASGELTPRDVLEAQLRRIDQLDARIRSVTDRYDARALAQADEAATRWRDGTARPLEGITVALKEEQAIAGESLTFGSQARAAAGATADIDHPVVERVREAGGIAHIRTTTPEYSAAGFSRSRLWGETISPWDARLSSGGSSGGSGAALAAGFTTVATGSDVAGSLRIPASACGVVGFKPPYASIAALPTESFDTYCHDGAMGRTVRDTVALHDVLAGQHPRDFISLPHVYHLGRAMAEIEPSEVRVGVARRMGDAPQLGLMDEGIAEAMSALSAAGVAVTEVHLPWNMHELAEAAFTHYGSIMAPMIRAGLGEAFADAEPYTRDFVEAADEAHARNGHFHSIQWEARVQADLAAIFADVDVVVCPTGMVPALPVGDDVADHRVAVGDETVEVIHHLEAFFAMPFNMASRLPVFAVPTGARHDGPPASVQVVGRAYDPAAAAAVAAIIEEAAQWYADEAGRSRIGLNL